MRNLQGVEQNKHTQAQTFQCANNDLYKDSTGNSNKIIFFHPQKLKMY